MTADKSGYDVIVVGGGHNGLVGASYLAKAGKKVLLLEGTDHLGGATTSVKPFPDFDAKLSRYSYLVSLLPDKIVSDLAINFKTLERPYASFTPYRMGDVDRGLLVANKWNDETENSFIELTGSDAEGKAWQSFYGEIADFAKRFAPTMLEPLRTRSELRDHMNLQRTWEYLIERPIGEIINERFSNDIVRGVVATDAIIGTFVSAEQMQANICFLYHLIGNGTGQWRVPQGGMGAIVVELERVARGAGVEIQVASRVSDIETSTKGVSVTTEGKQRFVAQQLLFAGAPQTLDKIRGRKPIEFLEGSQLKINMLLSSLPQLKSGVDPHKAFAGTFHANESFTQLENALNVVRNGKLPELLPLEMYCHTLTDPSILSSELIDKGFQTLTLFGVHTSASLFDADNEGTKEVAKQLALSSLNQFLAQPIEDVLAQNSDGSLAIEVKSPTDLEADIGLPRGNIFHRDLDFPFKEDGEQLIWGAETDDPRIFLAGAGARRGGGVSGIAGHNAAMAALNSPNL